MSVRARDRSRGGNAVVKGRALLQANLTAQLISSLFLTRGTGAATLTRATVGTFTDFEGLQKTALAGEVRETGARRVANLWPHDNPVGRRLGVLERIDQPRL